MPVNLGNIRTKHRSCVKLESPTTWPKILSHFFKAPATIRKIGSRARKTRYVDRVSAKSYRQRRLNPSKILESVRNLSRILRNHIECSTNREWENCAPAPCCSSSWFATWCSKHESFNLDKCRRSTAEGQTRMSNNTGLGIEFTLVLNNSKRSVLFTSNDLFHRPARVRRLFQPGNS